MRISDWSSDVCSSDLQTEDKRDDILLGLLDGQNQLNRRIVDLEVEIRKTKIERSAGILSLAPSNFGGLLGGSVQMPTSKRSEEHTSELQSLMCKSYAVFCLKKKKNNVEYTHLS